MPDSAITDSQADAVGRALTADYEGFDTPDSPTFLRMWHVTMSDSDRADWRNLARLAARLLAENGREGVDQ